MRISGKWILLALCLLISPPLTRTPIPQPALRAPAVLAAALPASDMTICGGIKSASGVRRWENAPVVAGARFPNVAALAALGDRPVIIYGAKLSGQQFNGVDLSNICFEESDLSRTDWRGASARGVATGRSNLSNAVMTGASLRAAVFSETQLDGTDASEADLAGARLEGGSFDGLDLRRARMHGFQLYCGVLVGDPECSTAWKHGVDARGADLTRAEFNAFRTDDWNFKGALIDRTVVQFFQIKAFGTAVAKGPVILENSGDERSMRIRLTPAEWRQLVVSNWIDGPDFACSQGRSVAERSICGSETLPWIDRQLGRVYRDALANGTATVRAQRHWLARRDTCVAKPEAGLVRELCFIDAYNQRLDELRGSLPVRTSFQPGEEQFFISSELAPPTAFERTALYGRIFPVLVATADAKLFVRAVGRNRIRAGAEAFGSNGHTCSLDEPVLDVDRTSGLFGAQHSKDWLSRTPSPQREDLVKFVGEEAWIGPQDRGGWLLGEFAGCGVRAGFGEMTRITIPASQHRAIAKRARALLANA